MPSPIVILALLAGGAYLLMKKPQQQQQAGGTLTLPTPSGQQATATIQVPTHVVQDEEVKPDHTPSVTLKVPTSVADATNMVGQDTISQTPPWLLNQGGGGATTPGIAQQSTVTTNQQQASNAIPAGVASFPTLPSNVTPQQVATAVIPAIVKTAEQAATTIAQNTVATNPNVTTLHAEEVLPDQDPHGTVTLARAMINAESSSGWKTALQPEITMWQSKVGLKADGEFGPGSAAKMAEEVGILPLIRFFPKSYSTKAAALKAYRDMLYTMAANAEQHNPPLGAALRSSAAYEQAQSWGSKSPAAIPASGRMAQATALQSAIKQAVA